MCDASVNKVITRPTSAITKSALRSMNSSLDASGKSSMNAPAAVNRIGAVMSVLSSLRDTRL